MTADLAFVTSERERQQAQLADLQRTIETQQATLAEVAEPVDAINRRRIMVEALSLARVSHQEQAGLLQVSTQTIRRDVKALNGVVQSVADS